MTKITLIFDFFIKNGPIFYKKLLKIAILISAYRRILPFLLVSDDLCSLIVKLLIFHNNKKSLGTNFGPFPTIFDRLIVPVRRTGHLASTSYMTQFEKQCFSP